MLEIFTAHPGQAAPCPPDRPKEKARLTTTSDEPQSENNNAATVPPDAPSCKCFADVQAQFALLGYTLHTHRTAGGIAHHLADEVDVPPRPTTGRTVFVVRNWNEGRHLASWHGVIGLLNSLQDARHATTTDHQ